MKPTVVAGARAALAAMKRAWEAGEPFALVLTDGMMPEMDGFDLAEQIRQRPELAGATIMMLSSAGHSSDRTRCRELGVSAHLTKPIKQSDLLDTILSVLHTSSVEIRESSPQPQPALPASHRRLHILLAEDNAINQRVALGILEKRGHAVVVAGNGKAALAALEREAFDLILMDVQMPEMDGFEATKAIRAREAAANAERGTMNGERETHNSSFTIQHSSLSHIPIVAMTAHAMKGDRERCLEAGMDAYVSKPLQAQELFAVIESVIPTPTVAESGAPGQATLAEAETGTPDQTAPAAAVFDRDAALDRVDGNRELLREIIGLFFDEMPGLLSAIQETVTHCDAKALERAAHTLKGAVSNFGAKGAYEAALRLEVIGRGRDLTHSKEAYAELEKEVARLGDALAVLREETAP